MSTSAGHLKQYAKVRGLYFCTEFSFGGETCKFLCSSIILDLVALRNCYSESSINFSIVKLFLNGAPDPLGSCSQKLSTCINSHKMQLLGHFEHTLLLVPKLFHE